MAADHFDTDLAPRAAGELLTWAAQPGVRIGDAYLLVTTAPDRRLRAWGWVVGAPDGDDDQGWRVTVRFGGHLGEPLRLRDLRDEAALAQWTPLARVTAGRLEGIPPGVWQTLRRCVQAQVAEAAPDERPVEPAAPAVEPVVPAERPTRSGRSSERRHDEGLQPAWPWDGLDRGRFFRELVQRVLLPQGFTLIELRPWRDDSGIDVVAHRPQIRWTRWVAQLDVTGEAVEIEAIQEIVQGRQQHAAQAALLVATGPVSEAARCHAAEMGVEVWDAALLRSMWLRATDGVAGDGHAAETTASSAWREAVAI